jgi:hypothetical protein
MNEAAIYVFPLVLIIVGVLGYTSGYHTGMRRGYDEAWDDIGKTPPEEEDFP